MLISKQVLCKKKTFLQHVSIPVEQIHLVHEIYGKTVFRAKEMVELGQGQCKVKDGTLGPGLHRQTNRPRKVEVYFVQSIVLCQMFCFLFNFLCILMWTVEIIHCFLIKSKNIVIKLLLLKILGLSITEKCFPFKLNCFGQ